MTAHTIAEASQAETGPETETETKAETGVGALTPTRGAPRSMIRRAATTVLLSALAVTIGIVSVALIRGAWMATPVLSGSMRPGFTVGGVVVGQRVPVDRLAVRDVIVFRRPDMPSEQIVHRIIKLTRDKSGQIHIRTQGDANPAPDPWTLTLRQPYAYRVRWSVPLIGYAAVAFQNHRGWILLGAGVVVLLWAANELRTRPAQAAGDDERGRHAANRRRLPEA